MAESLTDFLAREYEFLRGREGRDFFLAIAAYAEALHGKRPIRRALKRLERETHDSARRYVDEQNSFIAEATRIRHELAERAPEVDNSAIEEPDPASHAYGEWRYDSFAGFDDFVERDATLQVGYPGVPGDRDDPGVVSSLLQILRGRHRAAVYGEDASINAPPIRNDLDDLGTRIGNLGRRYEHALTRYRHESRTLPGLAYGRLVYFGSDLNPEPPLIETDEDVERWLDKTLREWGKPKTSVRKLVNDEQMDDWERESVRETEQFLKGELDRLHQELARRLARGPGAVTRFLRDEWVVALGSAIIGGLIVALILAFVFGVGGSEATYSVDEVAVVLKEHHLPADVAADFDELGRTTPTATDAAAAGAALLFGDDERVRGVIFDEQQNGNEGAFGSALQVWVLADPDDATKWKAPVLGQAEYTVGEVTFVRMTEANVVLVVRKDLANEARAALIDLRR